MKKRVIIISLILLLSLIILVCIKRWNVWFGNPPEPAYTSLKTPGRIQLTFGNDGQFSRCLSWQCGDTLALSGAALVKKGEKDTIQVAASGSVLTTSGGTSAYYYAELNGLKQGEYSYCVYSGGNCSEWYAFTVKMPQDNISFIYLGDIQDTINGTTKDFISAIRKREKPADFWVLGGDVIERPHDQYWNEYFRSMDSVSQTIPFIVCPGNHEYLKGISNKLEERFIYTFPYFIKSRTSGHAVYSINYGSTALITLDSNRDSWTLFSQRRWLKKALSRAEGMKWKIVVLHHPLYSVKGKINNYFIRMMFNPLIKKYGVDLVLQGHEHGYARMISREEDKKPAVPVYIIGQASPKDYRLYFNDKYDRFGVGRRFYHSVSIAGDSLSIKSYTDNNELYDDVRIIKKENNITVHDYFQGMPELLEINSRTKKMSAEKREAYEKDILERKNIDNKHIKNFNIP